MPKVIDSMDFQGGYATDLPSERMDANMVLKADNLYWKNGLVSRGGVSKYSTLSTYATVIRGEYRAYLNGLWMNIAAFDNGSYVELWRSTGTTWNAISTSIHFQTGYDAEMDQLNENIIFVNGYDRPHTLYYSTGGSYVLTSLDRYDTRITSTFDWWAGARFTTGTTEYVDYSTEAYSTGGVTFPMTPTTLSSDGHFIVSAYPFTKVVYTSAGLLSTHAIAAYHYWTSTGWKVLTSAVELAPVWTTSIGTRTLEIPYLSDWEQVGTTTMGVNLENRYAIRVTYPTAPSTIGYAQAVAVSDIHYLTRLMADERPSKVVVHNNRVHLASGNNVQISPYNSVIDWDAFGIEYFQDGGNQIERLISFGDNLLVVKGGALYGFTGNSYENWTKSKLSNFGSNWGKSVAVISDVVGFLSQDGIRLWNGSENVLVSKHIETDLTSFTKTGANAIAYKGFYILSFPGSSKILIADPDSFRRDDMGDGRISFFKWTGLRADSFQWNKGSADDGYLLAVDNSTAPTLDRLDNGNGYDGTTGTNFLKDFKSRYGSQGSPQTIKRYYRMKPDISGPGTWTAIMSADNGDTITTDISVTLGITSTYSTGHYSTDLSVPYQMDGKNLSLELQTQSSTPVTIYGFSADVETRRY